MARYRYVILNQTKPGREEEFKRWHAEQHPRDAAAQPGIVRARLFARIVQKAYDIAQALGEHVRAVLAELGYRENEIERLRADGAI